MSGLLWKLRKAFAFALALIFVPKCAGCGDRLPIGSGALCPICRAKYENAKAETCSVCASRLSDCFCLPEPMQKHGVRRMVKLFYYRKTTDDEVTARMIYAGKHKNLAALQTFFAQELAIPLLRAGLPAGKTVVTYPPRSRKSMQRDGFDHAAALARATARALSADFCPTLVRTKNTEQKRLSRKDRLTAAAQSYALRRGCDLSGKTVILCDDVCTTGATLLAASRVLRKAGAREVVFAVLALSPRQF